jgi:hypothetical protein
VIRVAKTLMPVHRYADARYRLVGGPPKTQAGDRDIPIPGWLCDQLAAMLAARTEHKPGGIGRHDYLFVCQSGIPLHRDKLRCGVSRRGTSRTHPDGSAVAPLGSAHSALAIFGRGFLYRSAHDRVRGLYQRDQPIARSRTNSQTFAWDAKRAQGAGTSGMLSGGPRVGIWGRWRAPSKSTRAGAGGGVGEQSDPGIEASEDGVYALEYRGGILIGFKLAKSWPGHGLAGLGCGPTSTGQSP